MAIDSRQKRASAAVLGLAFLAPSIVPDGAIAQADRQAIAHSYYGIAPGGAIVEIGGTCQTGNYSSSGGITLERVIGGTSQVEAFNALGGITLERAIGGTSQFGNYNATGGITLERVIGGTSQLGAVNSSGGITIGGAGLTLNEFDLAAIVAAIEASAFGQRINEIWQRLALDNANPLLNKTDGGFSVGSIDVTAVEAGNGDITQTRQ